MDKFELGSQPCAVNLTMMLNELGDQHISKKVARALNEQNAAFWCLAKLQNTSVQRHLLELLHREFRAKVDRMENVPYAIKTHLLCVETAHFRSMGRCLRFAELLRLHPKMEPQKILERWFSKKGN